MVGVDIPESISIISLENDIESGPKTLFAIKYESEMTSLTGRRVVNR